MIPRGARTLIPPSRATASLLAATLALAGTSLPGCGPDARPKEIDVSPIPTPVLDAFRRDQPNSVILAAGLDDGDWRIDMWTPLGQHKSTWYSKDGDKLRGW